MAASRIRLFVCIVCLSILASGIITPQVKADKTRNPPPESVAPSDGLVARYPKTRLDQTPSEVIGYKKYFEKNGVSKIELKLNPKANNVAPNKTIPTTTAGIIDFVSMTNVNGVVSYVRYPIPVNNFSMVCSTVTNPSPPPPEIITIAKTYSKYNFTNIIPPKMDIQYAYLDFSNVANSCSFNINAQVKDVGTSWDGTTLTWNTQPTPISTEAQFIFAPNQNPKVDITSFISNKYYSGNTAVGLCFELSGTPYNESCGAFGTIPELIICYTEPQGGSPAGKDLTFGNGAGEFKVNTWTGAAILTQNDLSFSIPGGLDIHFTRVYNSVSLVNYGMGPGWISNYHQSIEIDSTTHNATWRTYDGSYQTFTWNPDSMIWSPPCFSYLGLQIETINSINYYVISDKYKKKYYFEYGNNGVGGLLVKIINLYGAEIQISWNGDKIFSVTDAATNRSLIFLYDIYDRLFQAQDPEGKTVNYTYNASNQMTTVTDPNGGYINFTYNASSKLASVSNPDGFAYSFIYNQNNEVASVRDALLKQVQNYSFGLTTAITDSGGNTQIHAFDDRGYLSSITLPRNITMSCTRNSMKQIATLLDSRGQTTTYNYDSLGNLLKITYPDSKTVEYEYNQNSQIADFKDKKGNHTEFEYYQDGRLSKEISDGITKKEYLYNGMDMTGIKNWFVNCEGQGSQATWSFTNDSNGYPKEITSPEGVKVTLINNNTGQTTSYIDALNNQWDFTYNNKDQLVLAVSPDNNNYTFNYNGEGQLTSLNSPGMGNISYGYDSNGRIISITRPGGYNLTIHRKDDGKIEWMEDNRGCRTTYNYNESGMVSSIINPVGDEITVGFGTSGMDVVSFQDESGALSSFEYGTDGKTTKITDPNGGETRFEYDENGNVTKITNPFGKEIKYLYDSKNRCTKVTDVYNNDWTYTYDNADRLIQTDGPSTLPHKFCYDKDGRLISSINSANQTQSYEYDNLGRLNRVIDPMGIISSYSYDKLNQVTSITTPSGTESYEYNNMGKITKFTDKNSHEWKYEYDNIARRTKTIDPALKEELFSYDMGSNMNQYTKPPTGTPATQNYEFDCLNRVTRFTDELGNYATYTYNTLGRQKTELNRRGDTIVYSYTPMNLVQSTMPAGGTDFASFTYDIANNMSTMGYRLGGTNFTYDFAQRMIGQIDNWNFAHDVSYNAEDMVTRVVANGDTRDYSWNAAGLMINASRAGNMTQYTYNDNSWMTQIQYPNNVNNNYYYDTAGRMNQINISGVAQLNYGFDNVSNITSSSGNGNWAYTYNSINQLAGATGPGGPYNYTYDSRGNKIIIDINGSQRIFTYNIADELTRCDYQNGDYDIYTYDGNGNCTRKQHFGTPNTTTDFTYSKLDRLDQVNLPDGVIVKFEYDALGRRIQKRIENGNDVTIQKFHYLGNQITTIDIDASINDTPYKDEIMKILHGDGNMPLSFEWTRHNFQTGQDVTDTYYYHYDIGGNLIAVTNTLGAVVAAYQYDPLGNVIGESNPLNLPMFFTFRAVKQAFWDREIGIYYTEGYYRPDSGSRLQGTGHPESQNMVSGALVDMIAKNTRPANQHIADLVDVKAACPKTKSGLQNAGAVKPNIPSAKSDAFDSSSLQYVPEPVVKAFATCTGFDDNYLTTSSPSGGRSSKTSLSDTKEKTESQQYTMVIKDKNGDVVAYIPRTNDPDQDGIMVICDVYTEKDLLCDKVLGDISRKEAEPLIGTRRSADGVQGERKQEVWQTICKELAKKEKDIDSGQNDKYPEMSIKFYDNIPDKNGEYHETDGAVFMSSTSNGNQWMGISTTKDGTFNVGYGVSAYDVGYEQYAYRNNTELKGIYPSAEVNFPPAKGLVLCYRNAGNTHHTGHNWTKSAHNSIGSVHLTMSDNDMQSRSKALKNDGTVFKDKDGNEIYTRNALWDPGTGGEKPHWKITEAGKSIPTEP